MAAAWVWANEYRTQGDYQHIRLGLLSCPVGNDIHKAFAEIALQYDCVLSYHAYDKFLGLNQRDPLSWRYHCGRWSFMEQSWGLKPKWMFGEAGPYEGVIDGWRSSKVLGGNQAAYVDAVRTFIKEIRTTPAFAEGRILGFSLFTTGGTPEWKWYETKQPEMDALSAMIAQEWVAPPPPPAPVPRQYGKRAHIVSQGIARKLFDAVIDEAWERKESVFFSIDDALQPPAPTDLIQITSKEIVAWNVETIINKPEGEARAVLEQFAAAYYPQPVTTFEYPRLGQLFDALNFASPVGSKIERDSGVIWPGGWIDANPFLTRYPLGNSFAIHTGADLNLNTPTYDLDRNKPVYAVASGKVTYSGVPSNGWQGVVVIRHQLANGQFVYTRYAHLQPEEILVVAEDWVKVGEILGLTGRNITTLGPGPYHLHFDISTSNILASQPGHWPGDNLNLVMQHYVDPKAWILTHL